MIGVKHLTVKNFMSVGNNAIDINFDQDRTIIFGKNGSGKSTIFLESITYALYGKPFRKLKMGQLVNTINQKNCIVELSFVKNKINFKIKRGQKPALFEIYREGVLIDQSASTSEYQDILNGIIGIDINTFKQIIAIGTAGYLPFMQLPSARRRSMIEDLIGIDVFSIINEFNKGEIRQLKTDKFANDVKIESAKKEYQLHKKYESEHLNNINEQIAQHELSISQCEEQLSILHEEDKKNSQLIFDNEVSANLVDDHTSEINALKRQLVKLTSSKRYIDNKKQFLNDNSSCPSCDQAITEELKCEHIPELDKQLSDVLNEAKQIGEKIKELNIELSKAKIAKELVASCETSLQLNEMSIANNTKSIENSQTAIEQLRTQTTIMDVSSKINVLTDTLKILSDKRKNINTESVIRDIIKNMISDTGVKKFIIGQYLPLLNGFINKYLESLGANYVFILDEEFNETIKSRGRDTFSYESFSQGEKGRIDLSIILAFRKLVEARSNSDAIFDILIMDEILDSSLDAEGTENVNNLLKEINSENGGTRLYVVSHSEHNLTSDIWTDSIELEKVGNFTRIKPKQ